MDAPLVIEQFDVVEQLHIGFPPAGESVGGLPFTNGKNVPDVATRRNTLKPMSILVDVLLEIVGAGLGPSSDRGMVALTAVASLAFAGSALYLIAVSGTPLSQPAWGLLVFAGSLMSGSAGVLVSWLHLRRTEDRLFPLLCLTAAIAAIAIPAFWLIAH